MERIKRVFFDIVRNIDPVLFICSVLLSLISIVTIVGAADNFGMTKLYMQVFIFIVGIAVTLAVACVDLHALIDRLWIYMLAGSAILLILTLFFGSSGVNLETSNKSWIELPFIGIMIQPSEFIKCTFICTFAKHTFSVRERINHPVTLLGLLLHAAIIVGLILASGDLGVALVYVFIIAVMLFCAGLHPLYFVAAAILLVLLFPFLWELLEPYQQKRILVGFNPSLDPLGKGLQPLRSRAAIAAGGFFGNGIFGGYLYENLAASHTDFIYATVCEKFGFVGGAAVLIIFIIMVVRVFMIAHTASASDYGGLICVGVGAMLIFQILLNVGMCFAMLPVIGLTLPLLSCGGSSMLATFIMLGLLHNVYSHSPSVAALRKSDTLDIDISLFNS